MLFWTWAPASPSWELKTIHLGLLFFILRWFGKCQERRNLVCKGVCSDWMPPYPSHFHQCEKISTLHCQDSTDETKVQLAGALLILSARKPTGRLQDVLLVTDDEMSWAECWSQQLYGTFGSSASTRLSCSLRQNKGDGASDFASLDATRRSLRTWTKEVKAHFKS